MHPKKAGAGKNREINRFLTSGFSECEKSFIVGKIGENKENGVLCI
jgi:hypothetical protein